MDEDKKTIEGTEYTNKKPIVGAPSSYGIGSVIRELDDEGRIKRVTTSGAPLDTRNVKTPQEAATPNRIGDYYFDKTGTAQIWQNSPTDLLQKYQVAVGGTEKPAELLRPRAEALSALGGAAAGASALAIGGPAGMAVGGLIGGLIGGLSNLNSSREEALKQWREQDVKYDSAVSFYKDDDGSVKYKVDYQKLGTGGERSGEAVREAQNRETQVWLGDDGRLKVKVSPIFASTARYQEMLDFISQNYAGLNKNTDNLEETLTEIRNAIDSEARDYVTNMKLYADFSHKFPNASPETIVASYATETAGYIDPAKMGDYQVTTLGDGDKATTQSAEQFFNSILDMDKTKRNELATKLNDIIYGESGGYTDEQRAVAYGELQAMYAASANPEKYEDNKYQGMMDADPFVSFMNSFAPLGLNAGDVIKFVSGGAYSKQEMLNQDEWAQFIGGAAGIGAGLGLWKGASSLVERGLKLLPGTAQLYAASAAGKGYDNVMALFAEGKTAAGVGAWAAEAAFKTLKVGTLDAVLAGAQTAVSGTDFWANFGQDFARDAVLEMIFSYYDMAQMQKAVSDNTVYVYVDPKTGNLKKLNTYAGEKFSTYEMSDDGLITEVEYREGLDVTQWQTRQGNTGTVLKTPGGTTVTVVDGRVEYTPSGKIVDGEVVDITEDISEVPVMNSGVVNTSRGQTDIATLLERAGLPADTQVMEMPESAANSAIVAGKIARAQGTKFGMEVYKQLFNSNAVLDVANNEALAKDGDLNAWRNAQELFVSVANNAQRNLQDIQNGVYLKEAAVEWAKTVDIMGRFNYQYKYNPKTDGAYINAILNIERAQLLNDSRVEGDTTDYVAKAVETYKDVLTAMPADRGQALQEWVAQGKKWLKVFNDSVRKSGKVDVAKLDNITETDISETIGWFPVWGKRQKYTGLLDTFKGINKERNPYKSWLRDGEWVPADQLGDPWQNMNRYMAFMTNNMGLNDMNEAAMDVYDRAGLLVDNTPTDTTIRKRKLDSVKNKDELNKKLDDMVAEAKKEVEEQALTPTQYSDMMAQIYEESAIPETVEALATDVPGIKKTGPDAETKIQEIIERISYIDEQMKKIEELWDKAAAERAKYRGTQKEDEDELPDWVKELQDKSDAYLDEAEKIAEALGYHTISDISRNGRNTVWRQKADKEIRQLKNTIKELSKEEAQAPSATTAAEAKQWDDFWQNAPAQTRKDIRSELEKTSLQTGYGISNTRARLNAQVPGFDIIDWSLLGRHHVNGLISGGWYSGMQDEVKMYIVSIPQIKKLLGIEGSADKDAKAVLKNRFFPHINTKGMNAPIPITLSGNATSENRDFFFDPRGGHSMGKRPATIGHLHGYLEELQEQGIKKIPIVVAANNGLPGMPVSGFSLSKIIKDKLGYVPQDITADVQRAFSEYGQIPWFHSQHAPLGSAEFNAEPPTGEAAYTAQGGVGDALWVAPNSSYTDEYGDNKTIANIPVKYFMSDKEKNSLILKLEERNWELFNKGYDNLSKKEKNEYDKITEIIEPRLYKDGKPDPRYGGKGSKPEILSYRALAEYAGKPIIDTTMDMNDRGIAGTAFFYYKGVSPEFDKELGQQLAAQALFDRQSPQWTGDTIATAMEEYDGMSLGEMIDNVTMGQGFGEDWDDLFEQFSEGLISSSELSEKVSKFFNGVKKKYPGIGKVMQETWDNNTVQDLQDMKFRYWHPSTGYPTVDDKIASRFLEEMGERPPQSGEPTPEGQASFWDVLDPTNPANVPTEPQFVQPRRKVTYEDYQKGLQADPEMAGRIRDSYRGAMADRLIKEATRAVALAENYLGPYGYGADWQSYLNTSLIPDLQAAINQNMLPEEFQSFVQARMAQAMQDMAPYQSPEMLLKSRLERVAEEWREWALKHIKAGRATQGELKEFANTHELNLPNDKRPLPSKIKHALWQMVQDGKRLPEINGLNPAAISKEMDQGLFYRMLDDTPLFQSAVKDKNELLDLISLEKNKETTDGFTMGAASTAAGLGGRFPITKFKNGKPYTRFIKYDTPGRLRIAEQTMKALNDKELLKEDGLISRTAAMFANDFRLLVTGWDPSRAIPNLFRDTTSSIMKTRFISPKKQLQAALDLGNYTPKQRANLEKAIENAANAAAGSSYNSAYRSTRSSMTDITKQYLSQNGASPMKRFFFNLRKDKRSIAEWPMEFFEGYSRRANARSLAAVQLRRDQKAGKSYKEQMKNATTAADWAGREYTANFQRKGEFIGRVSKYVAYQSSAYAGFDSWVRAFINDPTTVSRNFAAFVLAYLVLLADTLSREDTRKQYYRLSEYDRENQIVIGMGDSILTIPMDQTLAGMIFPYRRIMETLNGTDPVSFFEFVWGTLTAALPPDLSGFSEGDGFNLSRGLQKLAAQNMPNIASGIVEASTGLDLYYGSQTSVSDETLRNYGIYNPTAGDYTTTGNDSEILRNVANTTGIPQWQLQVMLENYGGNIGKYVLNILDKMAGAPEERQGGKDFANTVFNSFTGLDQDAASSAFYEGIQQLGQEKNALLQKISDYNESLKTASGDAKIELQNKIQQAKREYGTKVGDFVDKYISAYEITGGLSKKQAQQVYYLFRLDDDDTIYQSGSVEEYYNNQALQQFKDQATALSAPVLDQYYNNRRGNVYQDSEGVWRRYLPSASQAMKNSIYGAGEQQMVDLLNILEGKTSNLTSYRSQIKNLRNQAYEAGDWDTRDALAYELDKKVIEAISPYIERYGAEYVLGNSDVLSYLSEWFIVPDDFIRTKKGKYVSLGNNASTQKAFVQPFIKYIFGLPTNFSSYNDTKITPKAIGEM